ncbi:MAG: hypothetical protein ACK4UO_17675 [Pseudolabrys sp.]
MCIACELGFWMAMEDEPPAAKPRRKADDFACDAPAEAGGTAAPATPATKRKRRAGAVAPRRRAKPAAKVSAARE